MSNNNFENIPNEISMFEFLYSDIIKEKIEQWTKEAEEAGMTLTEYLKFKSLLKEDYIPTITEVKQAIKLREQESKDELKDLSKRVENIEKKIKEDKKEQSKKIPQEPIWEKNSIPGPYCPRCNEKILTIKTKYCPNCGQAINMSGFLNYLFFGNTRWSLLKEMGIEEGENNDT